MRGLAAYVLAVASVAWLIPWPALWPATIATLVLAWLIAEPSNPRPDGGKRSRERGG